jgi:glycosyltransferase involved in cell wall biosynthesis
VTNPRPIRILRIIARLNIGGPAIHVALLTQKLGPPDYESTLVCGNIDPTEGDMAYYAESRGVQPRFIEALGREVNPLADMRTIWTLYRLMRELKPDVVHTHTAKAGFTGRVAAWLAGVPVIVHTFHGHVFKGYFSPPKTRLFILFEQMTARMSDTLITLTEGLRGELADQYHVARRSRITVLPLGFDLEPFVNTPRKGGAFRRQWAIAQDAPLVGIVGRIVPVKNHALFLKAAVKIRQKMPTTRFVLIGDGELRGEIEAQVDALGLRDAVIFTGWQKDVAPIYGDLDALVISSVNEGTPVSVIEALATRCPVVTTAVGGLPDLLDGGALGLLVPSQDADALAAAVLDVLLHPPDGAQAQALMVQRYGIDRLVSDLDSLYRALLVKKRRR